MSARQGGASGMIYKLCKKAKSAISKRPGFISSWAIGARSNIAVHLLSNLEGHFYRTLYKAN